MQGDVNLLAAWVGMLMGVLSGAVVGLAFHREGWLGGYESWPRRLVRLGHIAFFGIALLNVAYAMTTRYAGFARPPAWCAWSLAAANVLMPAVCFLSAAWRPMRHLFVVPVACVLAGVVGVLWFRT